MNEAEIIIIINWPILAAQFNLNYYIYCFPLLL